MKYEKNEKKPDMPNAFATNTVVMKAKTGVEGVPEPSLEDVEIAKRWQEEHKV